MDLAQDVVTDLITSVTRHEGYRKFPYADSTGHLTIGIGRNLSAEGISESEARMLLVNDLNGCIGDLAVGCPVYASLNDVRKSVLVEMAFNIGFVGLMAFKGMFACLENKDYAGAAKEMLNSKWAQQVGNRANDLAHTMEMGAYA